MKIALSAIASKALLLGFTSMIALCSVASSAEARLISQTPARDEAGNLIYNKEGKPVYDSVHTMYDMFERPVLTYTTRLVSGNGCSVPERLHNPIERDFSNLFEPACNEHDHGYGNAPWQKAGFDGDTGKIIADDRFMLDMLKICKERFGSTTERPRKAACDMAAILYVEAVKVHPTVSPAEWQRRQNIYTSDSHTQVMATMPIDPRTAAKRAELNRLRRDIVNTRNLILQERETHIADIQSARVVFEQAQGEVAKIQRDITNARNRIAQLNREIDAKERWFNGLNAFQKIGGAATLAAYAGPRRAEQGTLYSAIAALETAKVTATAALEVPRQTLRGLERAFNAAHDAPVELDPRIVRLISEYKAVLAI